MGPLLLSALLLAAALGSARAQEVEFVRQVRTFPNPQTDKANCHRNSTDVFVCIGPNIYFDPHKGTQPVSVFVQ